MAGVQRPSFLKRQKEQKRNERAAEKREARRLKKAAKLTKTGEADDIGFDGEAVDMAEGSEVEIEDAGDEAAS